MEATHYWKYRFWNKVWWTKVEYLGLDICLTLVSLVPRLVHLLLDRIICCQLQLKTMVLKGLKPLLPLWSCKQTCKTREGEINLDTKLLKIQHMSRPQIFTLAHQCLFWNRHFQCRWPPHEHNDQLQTSQHTPISSKSKPLGSHVVGSKYFLVY